jgi:heme oxygenase
MVANPLVRDLDDLQAEPLPDVPFAMAFDVAGVLGTLYVLEGSGLGARVLFKDALKLGLSQHYGARHLAMQAASLGAWHALLARLESAHEADIDQIADAAILVFDTAQRAMMRARDAAS